MENKINETLVIECREKIINSEKNNINKLYLGYVEDNCDVFVLNILFHCIENKDIFIEKQWNNIIKYINHVNSIIN